MSDVQNISGWMKKIQDGIWESFGYASKEIMNAWTVFIVSRMKMNRQTYPSAKPISIYQGNLARALQGGEGSYDDGIMEDGTIVYARNIKLPHAAISEYGRTLAMTQARMRAIITVLKLTKRYDPKYKGHKQIIEHPAFEFINDSIPEMSVDKISPAIMRHMETELNKIPNIEVVIGGK